MVGEGTSVGGQEVTAEGTIKVPTDASEELDVGDTVIGDVDPEK